MNCICTVMLTLLAFGTAVAANMPEHWVLQGQKAYDAGDYATAISCFREALKANPGDGQIHYNVGRAYLDKGVKDQAAEHFYRAGILFLEKGDKGGALRAYTMLRKANTKDLAKNLLEKIYPAVKNSRC